jgi:hypothetical protein
MAGLRPPAGGTSGDAPRPPAHAVSAVGTRLPSQASVFGSQFALT